MKKKQMTLPKAVGASSASAMPWDEIPWHKFEREVKRLQMRIAKAVQERKFNKAKSLQWILTHSKAAKYLAVKLGTSNKGKKTAGIDGVTWNTPKRKEKAVKSLSKRGYQSKPLRRIHIPKKNGKLRPLGIPTMKDRAMQALYTLSLTPVSETTGDLHSYGFRPNRSCADAIEQCFNVLSKRRSGTWVLEADIEACFDQIDHHWVLNNALLDKYMLNTWLKSGYCKQKQWFPTNYGTPQGGVISPTLANIVLDGLESVVKNATKSRPKIRVVRYADDFIVTGDSKETLETFVKPAIERFLAQRGLKLSAEKTTITHINDGFDFLGFNIRKYKEKLLIKPAKKNVKEFLSGIRQFIRSNVSMQTKHLIIHLNQKIRGWANYYRYVVAYDILAEVDRQIERSIYQWVRRRHLNKSLRWRKRRYYCRIGDNNWRLYANTVIRGEPKRIHLYLARSVGIKRHIKIRSDANPFDPSNSEYFEKRKRLLKLNGTPDLKQVFG